MKDDISTNRRKTDRKYLLNKSILFIGAFDEISELINILQRTFKTFESSYHLDYIEEKLDKFDIIFCLEDENSLNYLQTIRKINEYIPFVLLSSKNFPSSSSTIYIQDKLSHYIQKEFSTLDIVYILQNKLQIYDTLISNKQLEEKNKAYLEMLDKFVIVSRTDLSGRITYVNDIFCEVNKYTKEELIGKSHNITRHPDTNIAVFKELWKKITNNEIWEGILKNQNKEKETYIAKTIIFPFYDNGVKIGYMAIRYVITDEINQNKDLKAYIMTTVLDLKKQLKIQYSKYELAMQEKNDKIKQLEILSEECISKDDSILQKKLVKQKNQIGTYDERIKEQDTIHKKRIAEYLKEKRSTDAVIDLKNSEIIKLTNEKIDLNSNITDLEIVIDKQEKVIKELKKQLDIEKDLLKHREDQLLKLEKN